MILRHGELSARGLESLIRLVLFDKVHSLVLLRGTAPADDCSRVLSSWSSDGHAQEGQAMCKEAKQELLSGVDEVRKAMTEGSGVWTRTAVVTVSKALAGLSRSLYSCQACV